MALYNVDSLRAAYTQVRLIGREDERAIARLLNVLT